MLKYVGKRITGIIPTIILISIFVFMFVRLIPGDPARLVAGDEASYETVEMIREELGLNKPVVRQYIDWVSDIFHGDLGNSIKTGKPVTYEISLRYRNTLRLAGIAIVWGVALGLLIGIWAGTHRSKWQDYTGMTLAIAGQAVPNFWIGLIIADEPVSALDVSIQSQVLNLMNQLKREMGLTYIFVAHDLSVVEHISDRVGVMYLGNFVEIADKESLYVNPLHPYTQALLSAVPIPDPTIKRERIILQGNIPSPLNAPKGCKFHTRCPKCMDICAEIPPEKKQVDKNHCVYCHLYD